MDRVLTELIRALNWPDELDLKGTAGAPLRRPSPYWIQRKVEEKLRETGLLQNGRKGGVESRWKKIESIVDMQLVINLDLFGYNRAMVTWEGGPVRIDEIVRNLRSSDFIEQSHAALLMNEDGGMSPTLTTEIVYSGKEDFSEKMQLMSEALNGLSVVSVFDGEPVFSNGDVSALHRLKNRDREPREKVKKVLKELLKNPLIRLPALSTVTGLSRAETKKIFYDLVRAGALLFEPAIDSMALSDFTISSVSLIGEEDSKEEMFRKIVAETGIADRILIVRKYYRKLISLMCWSSSYYDIMELMEEIENSSIAERTALVWQFRSIPMRSKRYPFLD